MIAAWEEHNRRAGIVLRGVFYLLAAIAAIAITQAIEPESMREHALVCWGECRHMVVIKTASPDTDINAIAETVRYWPVRTWEACNMGKTSRCAYLSAVAPIAAMKIGRIIRAKAYTTFVSKFQECASACALIWLAGVRRFGDRDTHIGFHAASITHKKTGKDVEIGMGNALIGAYLRDLGFSDDAIAEMTVAAPDDMNWLSLDDARELGVKVEAIPLPPLPPPPPPITILRVKPLPPW